MVLITTNLFDNVLIEPVRNGADELFVVSGYAAATMVARHVEFLKRELNKNISIRLIVGMCSQDGIPHSQHIGFQRLQTGEYGVDFTCGYVVTRPPVHSKVYSWLCKGEPISGFVGSANYSQNAFGNSVQEVLIDHDAQECFEYYQSMLPKSMSCLDEKVPELINIFKQQPRKPNLLDDTSREVEKTLGLAKATLTLLSSRTDDVPERSGLNWGQRPDYNREPNQAYINIPSSIGRSGFFPERYIPFIVRTDDGEELICVRAQDDGKGLHTTLNNSILGAYFRKRLGLETGAFVTKRDLLKYGRTDVDFYKIDDENYLLDFSVSP